MSKKITVKPKCTILKMHDSAESARVHKEHTFDLPMRVLIVGKSMLSGKTNCIGNLVLRPFNDSDEGGKEYYRHDFHGSNIYIVCPSTTLDAKWNSIIAGKEIPPENIYMKYDEQQLEALYDRLERQHEERKAFGDEPVHTLVIMDDCAFSGSLKDKMHGVLTKIFCNGRHCLINVICTMQKYSQCSTTARENATGLMLFECSLKQLDLIMEDHCHIEKNQFKKLFREATKERHSFMVVNYSNPTDRRYQDSNFNDLEYKL